jgi:hypothetical protein
MFITVAICTLKRAKSLRRTLDSLAGMRVPSGLSWEIVIVRRWVVDGLCGGVPALAEGRGFRRANYAEI